MRWRTENEKRKQKKKKQEKKKRKGGGKITFNKGGRNRGENERP